MSGLIRPLQLKQHGYPVQDEDLARLSSLIFEHINMLGQYSFAVPEEVARGELRPLHNPDEDQCPSRQKITQTGLFELKSTFCSIAPPNPGTGLHGRPAVLRRCIGIVRSRQ
ncbi:hypothetical protein C1Y31_06265 [Pseudomonas sp. FW305-25]|nr:hypothetical protein C1Y31_06265 [Pseudomonas sp. FW305-25]PMY73039.1 hypothetical protein C1Y32_09040 [Pseudomonas sp. FW126-L8]PNA82933.1 hypothetical protein C1Y33_02485 [Pseudomonas sp. FW305-76]